MPQTIEQLLAHFGGVKPPHWPNVPPGSYITSQFGFDGMPVTWITPKGQQQTAPQTSSQGWGFSGLGVPSLGGKAPQVPSPQQQPVQQQQRRAPIQPTNPGPSPQHYPVEEKPNTAQRPNNKSPLTQDEIYRAQQAGIFDWARSSPEVVRGILSRVNGFDGGFAFTGSGSNRTYFDPMTWSWTTQKPPADHRTPTDQLIRNPGIYAPIGGQGQAYIGGGATGGTMNRAGTGGGSGNYTAGGGSGGDIDDITKLLQKQQDAANKENQSRYKDLLSFNKSLQDSLVANLNTAYGPIFQNSASELNAALAREADREQRELSHTEASTYDRGIHNTTILDSLRAGVKDDSARRENELRGAQRKEDALYRAQYGDKLLGILQSIGGQRQAIVEGRTDQAPDMSAWIALLSQARNQPGQVTQSAPVSSATPQPTVSAPTMPAANSLMAGGGAPAPTNPYQAGNYTTSAMPTSNAPLSQFSGFMGGAGGGGFLPGQTPGSFQFDVPQFETPGWSANQFSQINSADAMARSRAQEAADRARRGYPEPTAPSPGIAGVNPQIPGDPYNPPDAQVIWDDGSGNWAYVPANSELGQQVLAKQRASQGGQAPSRAGAITGTQPTQPQPPTVYGLMADTVGATPLGAQRSNVAVPPGGLSSLLPPTSAPQPNAGQLASLNRQSQITIQPSNPAGNQTMTQTAQPQISSQFSPTPGRTPSQTSPLLPPVTLPNMPMPSNPNRPGVIPNVAPGPQRPSPPPLNRPGGGPSMPNAQWDPLNRQWMPGALPAPPIDPLRDPTKKPPPAPFTSNAFDWEWDEKQGTWIKKVVGGLNVPRGTKLPPKPAPVRPTRPTPTPNLAARY